MKNLREWQVKLFDSTLGKFVRLIQRSLIVSSPAGEKRFTFEKSPTLWELACLEATKESLDFVKSNMQGALYFHSREAMFTWIQATFGQKAHDDKLNLILEFGVYTGKSINMIAELFPTTQIIGFDSFSGLPEHWAGFKAEGGTKGFFDTSGQLPILNSNVELRVGLFHESLPQFLTEFDSNIYRITLVHFDADLYSSTKFVLDQFEPLIDNYVIFVFDEFLNYPGWKNHEFRAFSEFLSKNENEFDSTYMGFTETAICVQVKRKMAKESRIENQLDLDAR